MPVSPRRIAWVLAGLGVATLVFLVIVLTLSAMGDQSRASRLRRVGLPVEATVTRCVGHASGTGITTIGYTCRAAFTLADVRHEAVLAGSSVLRAPGDVVAAVVDPRDPSVAATAQSVARSRRSWTVLIAPASLFAALLGIVAIGARRLRTTTGFVEALTRRKSARRSLETSRP